MTAPNIESSTREERLDYVLNEWKCLHNCELCGKCHVLKGRSEEILYTDQYFQRGSDGKPCHTGIVESVNGNTFVTIEGNYGNAVQRVTRYLGSTVYGFGRPKYTIESEDEEMQRWKTIDDVPEGYYRDTVRQLMQDGIIKGKGNGVIDLTEDMLRVMIFCQRIMGKA